MLPQQSRYQEALVFCRDMAKSWVIPESEHKFFNEKLIAEAKYKEDMYHFLASEIKKVSERTHNRASIDAMGDGRVLQARG